MATDVVTLTSALLALACLLVSALALAFGALRGALLCARLAGAARALAPERLRTGASAQAPSPVRFRVSVAAEPLRGSPALALVHASHEPANAPARLLAAEASASAPKRSALVRAPLALAAYSPHRRASEPRVRRGAARASLRSRALAARRARTSRRAPPLAA